MLSLPSSVRVFICSRPTDMRFAFDRLASMAESLVLQDPLSGHLFVFRNRGGDKIKILYWDRDGLAIWYKRLEKGTFRFPESTDGKCEIDSRQLYAIIAGIDLTSTKKLKRFSLESG